MNANRDAYIIANSTVAVTTQRGKTVRTVVTPAVRRMARAQFGCATLEGVEIEDGGGSGTALSHWEMRQVWVHPPSLPHLIYF
jgi:hypothetical protein